MQPSPTPSEAWRFGLAALANADSLVAAARNLADGSFAGPARSLAISAREECGKFFAAALAGLEDELAPRVQKRLPHPRKQAMGAYVTYLPRLIDIDAIVARLQAPPGDTITLELIADALRSAIDSIENAGGDLGVLEAEITAADEGRDEIARQRGLYVDLVWRNGAWTTETPAEVSDTDARAEISKTEQFMRFARGVALSTQRQPSDSASEELRQALLLLGRMVEAGPPPDLLSNER